MHDIIIVGAGPAGLYSAGLLEDSFSVLEAEEHAKIGEPIQCSGLISTNIEKFLDIDESMIEYRVKGAVLHSGGKDMVLRKPGNAAFVIDRSRFDKHLRKGVSSEIMMKTRVNDIEIKGDHVIVRAGGKNLKSRVLLGCDGPSSVVRRCIGSGPREIVKGIIAITREPDSSDFVELWFDKEKVTDGFFWRIPRGTSTEYGMLSAGADFKQLEAFFSIKEYERRAGIIPMGFQKTFFPRTLLIGDSASQVKPWSGGGVIYGLTCARVAERVIREAFRRNDFSEDFLRTYEEGWKREIGRNISFGMMFRELYKDMDNRDISRLFEKAGKKDMNWMDMDFPMR